MIRDLSDIIQGQTGLLVLDIIEFIERTDHEKYGSFTTIFRHVFTIEFAVFLIHPLFYLREQTLGHLESIPSYNLGIGRNLTQHRLGGLGRCLNEPLFYKLLLEPVQGHLLHLLTDLLGPRLPLL